MGTKYGDVLVQFVYGADKSPLMLKKGEKSIITCTTARMMS